MNSRSIVLHVGLHKTGTTALQSFCVAERRWLRDRGVFYPRTGWSPRHVPAHHNLAWQLAHDSRFARRYGTMDDLRAEIADVDGRVILSSEDFTMAVYRPDAFAIALERLRGDGFQVSLVVFLREQASHAASLYAQLLRMGYDVEFREFLATILERGEIRFRHWIFPYHYDRFIDSLARLPAEVKVCSYDAARRSDSLLATFLEACGIPDRPAGIASLQRANTAPRWDELMALFHLNAIGPVTSDMRAALEAALPASSISCGYTPEEARDIARRFHVMNRSIATRWGVDLAAMDDVVIDRESPTTPMSVLFSRAVHERLAANQPSGSRAPRCNDVRLDWRRLLRRLSWRASVLSLDATYSLRTSLGRASRGLRRLFARCGVAVA